MKKLFLLIVSFCTSLSYAKTVRYELTVSNAQVNLSGNKLVDFALAVNGSIPAPTLEFTEGDDAEITVNNALKQNEEVSIHWHGILLPPLEDGVAYVNTPPIFQGQSRVFKFKIRQNGTYWYHSHTMLQEQKGVFGPIVIHPKSGPNPRVKEAVIILSDWTDENPDEVLKHLRKEGDYYLFKKGTIRSYWGAFKVGGVKNYLMNQWMKMAGMDLSDVGYDAFLINGKKSSQLIDAKPGEQIRLRVINGSASTYFHLNLANLPMRVVASDGQDIMATDSKDILIAMAETYDILFTVPESGSFEFRATSQDGLGFASTFISNGLPEHLAKSISAPGLYEPMMHESTQSHHQHGGAVEGVLSVDNVMAKNSTKFSGDHPIKEFRLVLDGNMERYVWHVNGKTIAEDRYVDINEGDLVRLIYDNQSMMSHPMHLHGHFFRVVNAHGDYAPLKHTVDVPPYSTRTIEFLADEPGRWMLHCHNLYHMKSGLARIVNYKTFVPTVEIQKWTSMDHHLHEHWYNSGRLSAATNHVQADLKAFSTRNEFSTRIEERKDDDWDFEGDLLYRRWSFDYLNFSGGISEQHKHRVGLLGFGYFLPMMIEINGWIDSDGHPRVDVAKKFQWTDKWVTSAEYSWRENTDHESEYLVTLDYMPKWEWSAGLRYTGHSVGVGAAIRF